MGVLGKVLCAIFFLAKCVGGGSVHGSLRWGAGHFFLSRALRARCRELFKKKIKAPARSQHRGGKLMSDSAPISYTQSPTATPSYSPPPGVPACSPPETKK